MWAGVVMYFTSLFCSSFAKEVRVICSSNDGLQLKFVNRYGSSSSSRALASAWAAGSPICRSSSFSQSGFPRGAGLQPASSLGAVV